MQEPSPQGDQRSDAELIDAVRSGDPQAYGVLYARHSAPTTAMARYYARDNFTADDLVSEAFERTYTVIRGGGGPDVSFRAYIYTAVRRLAYEQTEKARKTHVTDDFSAFEAPEDDIDPAVSSFERTLVTGAFATLPERWQAVLWYVEVEGMSPPEVAPLLGLTANGVSALAYRAREGLREAYLQGHVAVAPTKSVCEEFRGKLGTYARGGLSQRDQAKVEKHLDNCDECAAIVAELRDVGHGMRAVIGPLILGGSAAAGLGWGATTGTGSASAAVVSATPRAAVRASRVAAVAAAVAAAAVIAAVIVFSGSPGDEPLLASPAADPVVSTPKPTVAPKSTPAPTRTPTPAPTPTSPVTSAPEHTAPANPPDLPPAPQPILSLAMADVGDLVLGRDGMVGVILTNTGKSAATSVSISMSLPSGVTIDPARPMNVGGASVSCVPLASGINCTTSSLPPGAILTVYVPVVVSTLADTTTAPSAAASAAGQASLLATAAQPVVAEGLGTRFIVDGKYAATSSGASFVSCDTADPDCLLAQGRDPSVLLDNNDWPMVATDGAGTGSVSSTTQVSLPAGAQVVFAGLYWSALTPAGDTDAVLGNLQLRAPDGTTNAVTASRVDHGDVGFSDAYQSFANVTDLVAAGGAGGWAASGARVGPGAAATPGSPVGTGVYGGWSLVIVYSDASLSSGRVTVFDGFENVTDASVSFVVAGIPDSTVTADVVAWEGDAGTTGDSLLLDGVALTRASGGGSSDNVFDSTADGSVTPNSFGVDVGAFLPVPLSQARAVLTATTSGDYYTVGVVTTTTR